MRQWSQWLVRVQLVDVEVGHSDVADFAFFFELRESFPGFFDVGVGSGQWIW